MTIEIIPSPRIDYCGACKTEHGYDCPLDEDDEEMYYDEMEEVKCPHCKEHQRYSFESKEYDKLVTWWGGEETVVCKHCDKKFLIYEMVVRSYEVTKK